MRVVRRVAIVAAVVGGLGLFGSGVHGMAQLDGRLAELGERGPAVRDVELRRELGVRDCPEHDRPDQRPPPDSVPL